MTRSEKVAVAALVALAAALFLVGLVSRTPLRHLVQLVPVLTAALAVRRRPVWSRYAALPVFLLWLFFMSMIWMYLLGWTRIVTGTFTPAEIVLTIVIGLACLVGLGAAIRFPSRARWWVALVAFAIFGALQMGAVMLSIQPGLATR